MILLHSGASRAFWGKFRPVKHTGKFTPPPHTGWQPLDMAGDGGGIILAMWGKIVRHIEQNIPKQKLKLVYLSC